MYLNDETLCLCPTSLCPRSVDDGTSYWLDEPEKWPGESKRWLVDFKVVQREQAREKAQKQAEARNGGKSQLEARAKGLQLKCPVCKTPAANYKVVVQHMEAKHPKETIPPESAFQS
ncbi:10270_t:CDS:2 [Acaulospora morrowiae]|uniref:10270_t:CDS:1 n=1 Tax=Acaulospora morrowiae TaxID=94023 RepID=A0A9N9BE01_9GLOM|nr:10270_t:CDS:2 [Acaulospora morrowiae]